MGRKGFQYLVFSFQPWGVADGGEDWQPGSTDEVIHQVPSAVQFGAGRGGGFVISALSISVDAGSRHHPRDHSMSVFFG